MPAVQLHVRARADRHREALLAPLRVKAQRVRRRRRVVRLVVDVVPERGQRAAERPVAAVLERDARAGRERHREVGVHAVRRSEPRIHRHQRAAQQSHPGVRHAEEVAQRHLDGWRRLAVPVAAEDRVAVVGDLRKGQRTVDVHHAARALVLEQRDGLARPDDQEVPVASAAVPGRRPAAARTGVGEERAQRMRVERMPCHARGTITTRARDAQVAQVPRADPSASRTRGDVVAALQDEHLVLRALAAGDRAGVARSVAGARRRVAAAIVADPRRRADLARDARDRLAAGSPAAARARRASPSSGSGEPSAATPLLYSEQ